MKLDIFGYKITISKGLNNNEDMPKDLIEALKIIEAYGLKAKSTKKQQESARNATKVRQEQAKQKIINAVNILRLEDKNLSNYMIAKESGCSVNTVKKYREFI